MQNEIDLLEDEFAEDQILKGYDVREVKEMGMKFCDDMVKEEPESEEFWLWLKERIRNDHQ